MSPIDLVMLSKNPLANPAFCQVVIFTDLENIVCSNEYWNLAPNRGDNQKDSRNHHLAYLTSYASISHHSQHI